MKHSELVTLLNNLCVENGLSYDGNIPVAVSPGVYMFQAIEMNTGCKLKGNCRQRNYYAIQYKDKLVLG